MERVIGISPIASELRNKMETYDRPWDKAHKLRLIGYDYLSTGEIIDPGVNFFVLTLEHIGAKPHASCEGHSLHEHRPSGFYILFESSYDLAMRISNAGYFTVELANRGKGKDWWALRVTYPWKTERDKRKTLNAAAREWQRIFWKKGD
jgi:hypothetical protein